MKLIKGHTAPDFQVELADGSHFHLVSRLKSGPVVLSFLKGPWCPQCQQHMIALQNWRGTLGSKSVSLLFLSTEDIPAIQKFLAENPMEHLFGSDSSADVCRSYGVRVPLFGFPEPASFIVDVDQKIRLSFEGILEPKILGSIGNKDGGPVRKKTG